jgi:hypothetical protein
MKLPLEISSTLDAGVLKYFSFKAKQYAKESAESAEGAVSNPYNKLGGI